MKIKRLSALIIALVIVFSITGCREMNEGEGSGSYGWEYWDETSQIQIAGEAAAASGSGSKSGKGETVSTVGGGEIKIAGGKKAMDDGLNFGGKKYVFAGAGSTDPMTLRALKAFEKKYNCEFTVTTPGSTNYLAKAAAAMSSGQPYDIGWFDGTQYPAAIKSNLWEPLETHFTTADEFDPKHPEKGGIRIEKSAEGFYWKGHLYAVCSQKYTGLKLLAYNKYRFEEEDLTDPMQLYKEGKWTWDALISLGKEVYVKDKYYLGGVEFRSNWVSANGGHWVVSDGDKIRENFSDKKIFNALKWTQDLVGGADSMINPEQIADANKRINNFITGKNYMCLVGDYAYRTSLSPSVMEASTFGDKPEERRKNLGMVPMPLGPDNDKKEYPCEQYSGICCGKGCDPRVAIAWAKFKNAYKDPVKDEYSFTNDEQVIINKLLDGPTCVQQYHYTNSSDSVTSIVNSIIVSTITNGKDISSTLEAQRQKAQNIIDSVVAD